MSIDLTPYTVEIEALREQADKNIRPYSDVYKAIFFYSSSFARPDAHWTNITDEEIRTAEFAPTLSTEQQSTWLWLRGAYQANSNDGSFTSEFIRNYTTRQYELRYGNTDNLDIQEASNDVAENFAIDVVNNSTLPPIDRVAILDGGRGVAPVFDGQDIAGLDYTGNHSPWSGSILFPFLGTGEPTRDNLLVEERSLETGSTYFKALEGTYDIISVAQASWDVNNLFAAWWNSGELDETISKNKEGKDGTLVLLESLRNEANEFFQGYYGLPDEERFQIGGDLPLYGEGTTLGILTNPFDAAELLARPNYITGSLKDDNDTFISTVQRSTDFPNPISTLFDLGFDLLGVEDDLDGFDIVNAGLGDDTIRASTGFDLIDGAEGEDTITYRLDGGRTGVNLFFEGVNDQAAQDAAINGTDPSVYTERAIVIRTEGSPTLLGQDLYFDFIYGIENYILTNYDDVVTLTAEDAQKNYHIQGALGQDTINFSGVTENININLETGVFGNITFSGFEEFGGGSGDDVIDGSAGDDTLDGGEGDDTLNGGDGNDFLISTSGFDTLNGGNGNDLLYFNGSSSQSDGGADDDTYIFDTTGSFFFTSHSLTDTGTTSEDTALYIGEYVFAGVSGLQSVFANSGIEYFEVADGTRFNIEQYNHSFSSNFDGITFNGSPFVDNDMDGQPDNPIDDSVTGTVDDDTLNGHDGEDNLSGGAGNDKMDGGQGADQLNGDDGDDLLDAGVVPYEYDVNGNIIDFNPLDTVSDQLNGGDGNDFLVGNGGGDILNGGDGYDQITGRADDELYGGAGQDQLTGGILLNGGLDNDFMTSDVSGAVYVAGSGNDVIDDGGDSSTLKLSGSESIYSFERAANGSLVIRNRIDGDSVTIQRYFLDNGAHEIEFIEFSGSPAQSLSSVVASKDIHYHTVERIEQTYTGDNSENNIYTANVSGDIVNSGSGANRYIFDTTTFLGNVRITTPADAFNDVIEIQGTSLNDISLSSGLVSGGAVTIHAGETAITLGTAAGQHFRVSANGLEVALEDLELAIFSSNGDVFGNPADDVILGSSDLDFISGFEGNDKISGFGDRDFLFGDEGNDTIFGGAGDDNIYGGADNDELSGGSGDDSIEGDGGNDYLYGESGNDSLNGGVGTDILSGGTGDDILTSGTGNDLLNGEEGNDTYKFEPYYDFNTYTQFFDGVHTVFDSQGDDDTLLFQTTESQIDLSFTEQGNDLVAYVSTNFFGSIVIRLVDHLDVSGDAEIENLEFSDGTIYDLTDYTAWYSSVFDGTSSAETLTGNQGDNVLNGFDGNDVLDGAEGNDILNGGLGDDTYLFDPGYGTNTINEDGGFDIIELASGITLSDITFTQVGLDLDIQIASGFIVTDFYSGDADKLVEQILFADGSTFDLTSLLPVTNTNDFFDATSAVEHFDGGTDGTDTVSYADSGGRVTVDLENNIGTHNDAAGDTYTSIERVIGTNHGQDSLYGDAGDNILLGLDGSDDLEGGAGADILDGGDNTDYARYTRSDAGVDVDLNRATQVGGHAQGDTLINIEHFYGTNYDDVFRGNGTYNNVIARGGDDILEGRGGSDRLYGGADDDTYIYEGGQQQFFEESAGIDRVELAAVWAPEDAYVNGNTIIFDEGLHQITFNDITLFETFNFDGHGDLTLQQLITLSGGAPVINNTPTADDDTLIGTAAAEVLDGGVGNDTVSYAPSSGRVTVDLENSSGTHNDAAGDTYASVENVIGTQSGSDYLYGDANTNILEALDGNDYLEGGAGADRLDGGDGTDFARYIRSDGAVVVDLMLNVQTSTNNAHAAGDELVNIEHLYGTAYDDAFYGNDAYNQIYGREGNDVLYGRGGSDRLYGGDGDDILVGGEGVDLLYGQAGADTFVFSAIYEYSNSDNVQDFLVSDGDKLDISEMLVSYDSLTDAITDFVQITDNGTNSYLSVDIDGGADNFIQIATLFGETGLTDEAALETNGTLIAA